MKIQCPYYSRTIAVKVWPVFDPPPALWGICACGAELALEVSSAPMSRNMWNNGNPITEWFMCAYAPEHYMDAPRWLFVDRIVETDFGRDELSGEPAKVIHEIDNYGSDHVRWHWPPIADKVRAGKRYRILIIEEEDRYNAPG